MKNVLVVLLSSLLLVSCGKPDIETYRKNRIAKFRERNAETTKKDCADGKPHCTELGAARERLGVAVLESQSAESLKKDMDNGVE